MAPKIDKPHLEKMAARYRLCKQYMYIKKVRNQEEYEHYLNKLMAACAAIAPKIQALERFTHNKYTMGVDGVLESEESAKKPRFPIPASIVIHDGKADRLYNIILQKNNMWRCVYPDDSASDVATLSETMEYIIEKETSSSTLDANEL
jgi:hypothetical protein